MKHGKKETGVKEEERYKNQGNSFFLPGKKNGDTEKRGANTTGNGEKKKGNLSDFFFLSDYPWDDE